MATAAELAAKLRKTTAAVGSVAGAAPKSTTTSVPLNQQSVDAQMNAAWGNTYTPPTPISGLGLDQQVAASELLSGLTGSVYQPEGVDPLQDLYGQQARRAEVNAVDSRYGGDLAWLDPTFQAQTQLLGNSQAAGAYADPGLVGAQGSILDATMRTGSAPIPWESAARQQSVYDGIGALQAPDWTGSDARQQQAYNEIGNSYNPQYKSDAQQQDALRAIQANNSGQQQDAYGRIAGNNSGQQQEVYDDLKKITDSGGTDGLDWDDGQRQTDQYNYLQEIVGGRGATDIEMANRQRQRADQEQWLRSQREGVMQNYAERGMTGSGMELLELGANQQASATRNSLADLDTAAQLEKRRLDAIGMSGDLAGVMRGQTADEQKFEASRNDSALGQRAGLATSIRGLDLERDMGLGSLASQIRGMDLQRDTAAGDMTNAMRDDVYQEQTFLAQNDLNRALGRGDLATQMRQGDYSEKTFNAGYDLDKLINQGNMANTMRDDTFQEQQYTRDSQLQALRDSGQLSTNMRNASFDEAFKRGTAADDFSVINTAAINSTNQGNVGFLQDSYLQMQRQRQQAYLTERGIDADVAIAGAQLDQRDNEAGFGQASAIGRFDTSAVNTAIAGRNAAAAGVYAPPPAAAPNTADAYGAAGSALGGILDRSGQSKGGAPVGGAPTAGSGVAPVGGANAPAGAAGGGNVGLSSLNPGTGYAGGVDSYAKKYGSY